MTPNTKVHDKFEYHKEDVDCSCCLYYVRKSKANMNGCQEKFCRFEDIRNEAIAKGRNKRPPGWFRVRLP